MSNDTQYLQAYEALRAKHRSPLREGAWTMTRAQMYAFAAESKRLQEEYLDSAIKE